MEDIKNFWSTPILRTLCDDLEHERNYILSKLTELENSNCQNICRRDNNTTVNGFQPEYNFLNDSECKKLVQNLIEKYSKLFWKEFSKNNPIIPQEVDLSYIAWAIKYYNGGYQNQHIHKESHLTGIWFLEVDEQEPGSGELHIHNPNPLSFSFGFYNETLKIKPNTNEVIILPNWVQHNVTPTTGKRTVFVWDSIVI